MLKDKPIILKKFGVNGLNKLKINRLNYQFKAELNNNDYFDGIIDFDAHIEYFREYSIEKGKLIEDDGDRHLSFRYMGKVEDINDGIDEYFTQQYGDSEKGSDSFIYENSIVIKSSESRSFLEENKDFHEMILKYDGYTLKSSYPKILNPIFKIYDYLITKKDNCFYDYLTYKFNKLFSSNTWNKYENKYGSLKQICNDYGIGLKSYDIKCNIIDNIKISNKKLLKKNRKDDLTMTILIHDDHIYSLECDPLLNNKLDNKVIMTKEIEDIFISYIDKNIEPYNVELSHMNKNGEANIKSFSILENNIEIIYTSNMDYEKCKEILSYYNIECNINVTLGNMMNLICKEYNDYSTYSIFPNCSRWIKGGYTMFNEENVPEDLNNISTRDMNKAYVKVLHDLKFLITYDIKTSNVTDYNGEDIIDYYLYNVKPKYSSLLMPNQNLYVGDYILRCIKENIEFDIIEIIETKPIENIYKKMIDDVLLRFPTDSYNFRLICDSLRIYIGKMSCDSTTASKYSFEFDRISTQNELIINNDNIHTRKLNDELYLSYKIKDKNCSITNRKPISILIHDYTRLRLYDYLLENKINSEQIIQIKTDSISINGNFLMNDDDRYYFGGFKCEQYKPLSSDRIFYDEEILFKNENRMNNYLNFGYAGSGKTKDIITNVIPNIIKDEKYIVLSPTHKALEGYRTKNMNCNVITNWDYNDKLQLNTYKHIIIDECGMISLKCWDKLITLSLNGHSIYCFGDFTQLPAINNDNDEIICNDRYGLFSDNFINWMFKTINNPYEQTNERNNFSWEYYNNLKNGKLNLIDEVNKYSSSFETSEYIVTWTRKTRDMMNYKKLISLGYKNIRYQNDKLSGFCQQGVRIIADLTDNRDNRVNNNLRDYGIYNSCIYEIIECNINDVTLKSYETNNIYIINKNDIEKYFQPAYAITTYKLQGQSIKSYHWANEDNNYLLYNKLKNIIAYVIISRLKTK